MKHGVFFSKTLEMDGNGFQPSRGHLGIAEPNRKIPGALPEMIEVRESRHKIRNQKEDKRNRSQNILKTSESCKGIPKRSRNFVNQGHHG